MTVVVKNKPGLQVPEATLKQAGIRPGDLVEFSASKGTVTIRPAAGFSTYTPTTTELAAIRKGRAAISRGEFVTLEQLLHDLDRPRRKTSPKRARKSSR